MGGSLDEEIDESCMAKRVEQMRLKKEESEEKVTGWGKEEVKLGCKIEHIQLTILSGVSKADSHLLMRLSAHVELVRSCLVGGEGL